MKSMLCSTGEVYNYNRYKRILLIKNYQLHFFLNSIYDERINLKIFCLIFHGGTWVLKTVYHS